MYTHTTCNTCLYPSCLSAAVLFPEQHQINEVGEAELTVAVHVYQGDDALQVARLEGQDESMPDVAEVLEILGANITLPGPACIVYVHAII